MAEFDDNLLRFVFNPRYMDFKTCSSLRSVSSRFNFFAAEYCLSIKELDLSHLTKAFNKHSETVEKLYPCLMEAVAKYCPNLHKISGVRICPESVFLASQNCLECLAHLNHVAFDKYFIELSDLFSFLKQLFHLRSVKVQCIRDKDEKVGKIPEEEKLAVPELSLRCGDFWRVFRVDCLEKAHWLC